MTLVSPSWMETFSVTGLGADSAAYNRSSTCPHLTRLSVRLASTVTTPASKEARTDLIDDDCPGDRAITWMWLGTSAPAVAPTSQESIPGRLSRPPAAIAKPPYTKPRTTSARGDSSQREPRRLPSPAQSPVSPARPTMILIQPFLPPRIVAYVMARSIRGRRTSHGLE